MLRKFSVVGPGLGLGAVSALLVAGGIVPSGRGLTDYAFTWAVVMGGPILGHLWGFAQYMPVLAFGWLGALLVPAHCVHANVTTGFLSSIGLFLWFSSGYLCAMVAWW